MLVCLCSTTKVLFTSYSVADVYLPMNVGTWAGASVVVQPKSIVEAGGSPTQSHQLA